MPNTEPITPEKLRETAKILDEAPWGGSVPAEENAVGDLRAAAEEIEVLRAALLRASADWPLDGVSTVDLANFYIALVRHMLAAAREIAKEKETT